ncbi:hypothetical protein MSU_0743 [Mycoplasma suis str. Illinois]|uniref:Uncharacterized protein n=1 Tax=Mycoplasma suis (strain Illinois) TaxID=768700 RepID=F0QRZ8_MYCSL|nr:hypothetical protein MSU_0743 [Mycoplasma suis str. Illinois]
MRSYRGGGILVSVAGSEYINSGQISRQIKSAFDTFVGWFAPTTTSSEPVVQAETQSLGNLFENISSKFEIVKSWITDIFQGFKTVFLSEKKFLEKLLKSNQNSQPEQQDSSLQNIKIDWRDFFNGLWILWGFAYRDVFRIEFGSFFYLVASSFVDFEEIKKVSNQPQEGQDQSQPKSYLVRVVSKIFEQISQRSEKGIKNMLIFLVGLNQVGKQKRKSPQQPQTNGKQQDNRISITWENMKWFGHSSYWVQEALEAQQ